MQRAEMLSIIQEEFGRQLDLLRRQIQDLHNAAEAIRAKTTIVQPD